MPRYFFHVHDYLVAEDAEGVELPDMAAVREFAIEGAHSLVCESIKKGHLNLDHFIKVTDEGGQEVLKLMFRDSFVLESARKIDSK